MLGSLVGNYNNTKHTAHGVTPRELYFTKNPDVLEKAYEKSYKYRKTRIFRGSTDLVRLASNSDSQKRRSKVGLKKAISPPWGSEIHTVEKHLRSQKELVNDRWKVSGKNKLFYRSQLQVIP
jgi:TPP-dependent indolepyruvate ferredoxin oxidoreductase alpha subunit